MNDKLQAALTSGRFIPWSILATVFVGGIALGLFFGWLSRPTPGPEYRYETLTYQGQGGFKQEFLVQVNAQTGEVKRLADSVREREAYLGRSIKPK